MKGRLFWKIVAVAWLSWFAVACFTGPELDGFVNQIRGRSGERLRQDAETRVQAMAYALQADGVAAADDLARQWPYYDRVTYAIRPIATGPMVLNNSGTNIQVGRLVPTRNGDYYVTFSTTRDRYYDLRRFHLATTDARVMIMTAIVVTITSLGLAFYLTRPVNWLRRGFKEASDGNLTVRLTPRAHGRKDEFADLARDFDAMTERLQALIASRERLLQDVSHELRSPLTRLQMAVGLVRQNPKRIAENLDRIDLEVRRLDLMVDELLTLSRAEIQSAQAREQFDLGQLMRSVVEDARFEAKETGKTLEVRADASWREEGAHLRGNAELLRRGVENVLRNALRVSSPGQLITVAMKTDAVAALHLIAISDHGPGVPEDSLEAMFEPFYRLKCGEDSGGLGLGLSIARRAVALHGGQIAAQNQVGGGLRVLIEIPVET